MKQVTIKHLYSMCDAVGGRWIWRGRDNGSGTPRMAYQGRDTSVYRIAYCVAHGVTIASLGRDFIWPSTEQGDINPAHLLRGTAGDYQTWARLNGRTKRSPAARAKLTKGARTRCSSQTKLTMERAREARQSDESNDILAERWGVSPSAIRDIRRGRTWRETVGPASIFSMGRGA